MIPDVLVFVNDTLEKLYQLFREHRNFELLAQNARNSYEKVEGILKQYSHKVLHNNLGYNIQMELYTMRMMSVHDLVDNGFLTLPEDPNKSILGMTIHMK